LAAQATDAPSVITDAAQRHFEAGVAYIDDPSGPKYEEALNAFRAAYAESPVPAILNNIGLCALNLERDGEAIEAYQGYLNAQTAELTPKARRQLEKDVAMLSASLVRIALVAEPKEVSLLDERHNSKGERLLNRYRIVTGASSLGLHPGHHRLTASAPGYEDSAWEFDADPATTLEHRFQLNLAHRTLLQPKPGSDGVTRSASLVKSTAEPRRDINAAVYWAGIASGVFAAAATTTGVTALVAEKDLRKVERDRNEREADRLSHSGRRLALFTDMGLGAALLSAGFATYFYFADSPKSAKPNSSSLGMRIDASVAKDRTGLSLVGQF
jgi:hypothetical protein